MGFKRLPSFLRKNLLNQYSNLLFEETNAHNQPVSPSEDSAKLGLVGEGTFHQITVLSWRNNSLSQGHNLLLCGGQRQDFVCHVLQVLDKARVGWWFQGLLVFLCHCFCFLLHLGSQLLFLLFLLFLPLSFGFPGRNRFFKITLYKYLIIQCAALEFAVLQQNSRPEGNRVK